MDPQLAALMERQRSRQRLMEQKLEEERKQKEQQQQQPKEEEEEESKKVEEAKETSKTTSNHPLLGQHLSKSSSSSGSRTVGESSNNDNSRSSSTNKSSGRLRRNNKDLSSLQSVGSGGSGGMSSGGNQETPRTRRRKKTTSRKSSRRKRATRRSSAGSRDSTDDSKGISSDEEDVLEDIESAPTKTINKDPNSSSDEEEERRAQMTRKEIDVAPVSFAAFDEGPAFAAFEGTDTTNSMPSFDVNFGGTSFPTNFGSAPSPETESKSEAVDDYVPPSFSLPTSPPKAMYDKSPIDNPPIVPKVSTSLRLNPKRKNGTPIFIPKQELLARPVANPNNGNVIMACHNSRGDVILSEFNPHTKTQVVSTPILGVELQRKVAQRYNVTVHGVSSVLTVACGLHNTGQGYIRTRVACLVDLIVLGNNEVLRVIATWQWTYAGSNDLIQLQSLLSPPSGNDFSYNPESLIVADSCVFISGASPKGPCVFLCKPTVRETWSANFVGKESYRISSMAVTTTTLRPKQQRLPYLAIALTDGSVSIWTYEAAAKVTSKTEEALRRLLFPLCRLDTKGLKSVSITTKLTNKDIFKDDDNADESTPSSRNEVGYCTHLEWSSPNLSTNPMNCLLLLAASFQGGLLLYHIGLPKIKDKEKRVYVDLKSPTSATQLSSTVALHPFGIARWPAVYHKTSVTFVDIGPHMPLSLGVLAQGLSTNLDFTRLALVSCILAPYRGSVKDLPDGAIHVWDSQEYNASKLTKTQPQDLIPCTCIPGLLYRSSQGLEVLNFSRWAYAVGRNPTNVPFGLTTAGNPYLSDAVSDKAGLLHVYTTYHCERRKVVFDDSQKEYLEWSIPSRRHWLVQTSCGDCKESWLDDVPKPQQNSAGRNSGEVDETVRGGTHAKVLVELVHPPSSSTMVPYRIARDFQGLYMAVWFQSITDDTEHQIALIERSNDTYIIVQWLKDDKEIVFLPNAMDEDQTTPISQALVLNQNGGSIALWQRKQTNDKKKKEPWQPSIGMPCRPILGFSALALNGSIDPTESSHETTNKKDLMNEYVDAIRLLMQRCQDEVALLLVGRRVDGRVCIISGPLQPDDGLVWSNLLPNIHEDPIFILDDKEEVTLILSLPSEQSIRGGIAVATTTRIMILSPILEVLSQVPISLPPTSLVPLGSYTVAYCSHEDHMIRYLSGLSFGASGLIAALPFPRYNYCPYLLLAVRPDRLIYTCWHSGSSLIERGQSTGVFMLPTATTKPALLLEPMIANAIATGGGPETSTKVFFRTVIEKFGRKVSTMTHGEKEGVGNWGAGLTPRVFELFAHYKLQAAASWILTGTVNFERSTNSRLLPACMPVLAKGKAAMGDADTYLHIIANGDQYFSEYVKNPDTSMTSTLPRPSDPSAFLSNGFAIDALKSGQTVDAMKLLDIVGTETSDSVLLQLSLALQMDPSLDATPILESLCHSQDTSQIGKSTRTTTAASLAALSLEIQKNMGAPSYDFCQRWVRPLAPSYQKGKKFGRLRPRIIGESAFTKMEGKSKLVDKLFATETSEMKLVWNEGPNREKENLLMLDNIQDWFGSRRPVILGKEGVKSAEDRGASTLADILRQDDDDYFGDQGDDDSKDGWVDGVGEGLEDEDKLSAYFRMSEGEDEENLWREEGFADISKFENKAVLVGCSNTTKLEISTSSVDEGESGKVKALFDLVFEESGVGIASALALPAPRGGSLDIGLMHGPENISRQKCSIEFWFRVPTSVAHEIILARRTFGSSADDLENVCKANDKSSLLWELALTTRGELEFRTVSGAKLKGKPPSTMTDDNDESQKSTIRMSHWNHVCITFKQDATLTRSAVNVFVKGISVCSDTLSFSPPNYEVDDFSGASALDPMLEKSYLVFGVNHPTGFRLTELRAWALERKDDEIRTMMNEYLNCAEKKRKLKVKIKKNKDTAGKFGLLAPPKGSSAVGLPPPKGMLAPPKDSLGPRRSSMNASARKGLLAPPKADLEEPRRQRSSATAGGFGSNAFGEKDTNPVSFNTAFGDANTFQQGTSDPVEGEMYEDQMDMYDEISPLWESAIPLSEQVRASAAAALIRGPPATRHFGGNRGGLPDYRELERYVMKTWIRIFLRNFNSLLTVY